MHVGEWATNLTLKLMFLSALHPLPPHYLTKEGGGLGTKIYREVRFSHIRRNASNYKPFHFQGLDNLLWNLIIVGGEDREFDCNQYRDPSTTPTQIPVNGGGGQCPRTSLHACWQTCNQTSIIFADVPMCIPPPPQTKQKKGGGLGTIILERSDFLIFANMHSIPSLSMFRV